MHIAYEVKLSLLSYSLLALIFFKSVKEMKNIVKQLRKNAGMRQEDMAKEVGVSRQTIIAIENDKYNPTLELAMKIAELLHLHVDEIFFLDDR